MFIEGMVSVGLWKLPARQRLLQQYSVLLAKSFGGNFLIYYSLHARPLFVFNVYLRKQMQGNITGLVLGNIT